MKKEKLEPYADIWSVTAAMRPQPAYQWIERQQIKTA